MQFQEFPTCDFKTRNAIPYLVIFLFIYVEEFGERRGSIRFCWTVIQYYRGEYYLIS